MKYILILVWIGFIAVIAKFVKFQRAENVFGKSQYRYPMWLAVLTFLPIIWLVGHRGWIGDTYAYVNNFYNMPDTFDGISNYLNTVEKDKGFHLFSCVLKTIIGNEKIIYLTIIAILQSFSLITVYRKYSSNYILSIFLFLASADYISWMCNGLRQFFAVTIIFIATNLMLKKKYIPLILVILLASTFHQSALIMIPIIFIAQGKAWNKKTLVFLTLSVLAVAYVGEFTNIMNDTLENTQYADMTSDFMFTEDDGTNPLRVAIYSIPAVLSFFCRKNMCGKDSIIINLCTNMSIITMGIYLVSMFTSGIYIGRIPIYTSLYSYILLPWEIEHLFKEENRKYIYIFMIICYLIYYYYQMHVAWSIL